jgi:hypothetical protein
LVSVPYSIQAAHADTALYALDVAGGECVYWHVTDSVLYTNDYWGIARGGAGNRLYGDSSHTHVNLGSACTTGTSGADFYYATVSGGYRNRADGASSTVSGGKRNTGSGNNSTIGGGGYNTASGLLSSVAGGQLNTASDTAAAVGGGYSNEANGDYSTVPGGRSNSADNAYTFAAGRRAKAVHSGAFVWADATAADFSSTGDNQFLIRAGGGVGINTPTPQEALDVNGNIQASGNIIATGFVDRNNLDFYVDPASSSRLNTIDISAFKMAIDAQDGYVITSDANGNGTWQPSVVGSGSKWSVTDSVLHTDNYWGLARGGAGNTLYGDSSHTHVNLGVACTTGTSGQNYSYATVGGGHSNVASGFKSSVGGGSYNIASASGATVCGGYGNEASDNWNTVGGGYSNAASGYLATVGGGVYDTASGDYSTVSGGDFNRAHETWSTIGGGRNNTAIAVYATVPGGYKSTAGGTISIAAGNRAKANHNGSVVLVANSSAIDSDSTRSGGYEQMVLRADGDLYITNTAEQAPYDNTNIITTRGGAYLSGNGGDWTNSSDRNKKENFTPVDGQEILELLEQLEITKWNYKEDDENITHIGPVAQDFYALFELGGDDKSISTIDPSGIALAAIKELYARDKTQQKQIEELTRKIDELSKVKAELSEMKNLVKQLVQQSKDDTESQYGLK